LRSTAAIYGGLFELVFAFAAAKAIQVLDQAYDERDAEMVQLYTNPAFDSLRSDPRFKALLRRINFPRY
jgi:hypothetical protein